MASQWFYARNGKRHGPVNSAQLTALAKSGQLSPTDLIWKEGMTQWVPAGNSPQLFPKDQGAVSQDDAGLPAVLVTAVKPTKSRKKYRGLIAGVQAIAVSGVLVGAAFYVLQRPLTEPSLPASPETAGVSEPPQSPVELQPSDNDSIEPTSTPPLPQGIATESEKDSNDTKTPTAVTRNDSVVEGQSGPAIPQESLSDVEQLAVILGSKPGVEHPLSDMVRKTSETLTTFHRSKSGPYVASLSSTGKDGLTSVRLWHRLTGKEIASSDHRQTPVYAPVAFHKDGDKFFSIDGEVLRAWVIDSEQRFSLSASEAAGLPVGMKHYPSSIGSLLLVQNEAEYENSVGAWSYEAGSFRPAESFRLPALPPNVRWAGAMTFSGKLTAVIVQSAVSRSAPHTLVVCDTATGKLFSQLPVRRPCAALPSLESCGQVAKCALAFTPKGDRLIATVSSLDDFQPNRPDTLNLGIFDLKKRKPAGVIPLPPGHQVVCTDDSYDLAAVVATSEAQTATALETQNAAFIYRLTDASKVCDVALGDPWDALPPKSLSFKFSPDGKHLVGLADADPTGTRTAGEQRNARSPQSISIATWQVEDGRLAFSLSLLSQALTSSELAISASARRSGPTDAILLDADCGIVRDGEFRAVVDIPEVQKTAALLKQGDADWASKKYEEAWQSYSAFLMSPIRGIWASRVAEVAGRGVDALAVIKAPEKAQQLNQWCIRRKVPVSLETDQGKALNSIWQEEERRRLAADEAKRKKEEEERQRIAARQAEEERVRQEKEQTRRAELQKKYEADLATKRKANQARAVRSQSLSAKQFIDKLQQEMDRGHLSASLIFENYVFQDVFGDPETDASFDVLWRRYGYRCKDGIVMLTVLVQGGRVTAKDIDRY